MFAGFASLLMATLGELLCYILYFHHIYRHDKHVAHLLRHGDLQRRHKKNAISFMGQFYGFSTKFVFLCITFIVLIKGKSHITMMALGMVIKFIEFGVMSIVEVMTSHEMRNDLLDRWKPLIGLLSYLVFWW